MPYEETKPADIVFIDAQARTKGKRAPSSEWRFHFDIYKGETQDRLNDEQQRYADNNNHQISNGILSLVARKVSSTDPAGINYESGMLRSDFTMRWQDPIAQWTEASIRERASFLNLVRAPDDCAAWLARPLGQICGSPASTWADAPSVRGSPGPMERPQ